MTKPVDVRLPFNDLITYVPKQLRKPMVTSLIDNLFNRFLTHDESVPFFGYVGKKPNLTDDKIQKIPQLNVERDINAIIPVFNFDIGTTTHAYTFADIIKRAGTIGIDEENLDWLYSQGNNFVPPINLDKFTNFFNYYWIGGALKDRPTLSWNPELLPEYYTIAKHVPESLEKENVVAVTTKTTVLTGSGFAISKFELVFTSNELFTINVLGGTGSARPLMTIFSLGNSDESEIEYNVTTTSGELITLLSFSIMREEVVDARGIVVERGKFAPGDKFIIDAPYLSKDYSVKFQGSPGIKGKISNIRSYNKYQIIDGVQLSLGNRVLVKNNSEADNGIYIVQPQNWVRAEDFTGSNAVAGAKVFVKGGSQANTFWKSTSAYGGFNFTKISGVTRSNTNDWQDGNFWVKNTELSSLDIDRSLVTQAKRPIIEYSGDIQLNQFILNGKPNSIGIPFTQRKTTFNQLPLFDLFRYDGTHSGLASPIFFYEEDLSARLDVHLQKRVKKSKNASKDFVFAHGAHDGESLLFFKRSGKLRTVFHPGYKEVKNSPVEFSGAGNGECAVTPRADSAQQIWMLRAISPTTFEVLGTKNKKLPSAFATLDVNTIYDNGEFSCTITPGTEPFQSGDTFKFQIGNLEQTNYVYKYDDDENISNVLGGITADVDGVGTWQIPRMFYSNPQAELNSPVEEGVLYSHFLSILQNQVSQKPDYAFGGDIKLWSEQQTLLVSLLMQRDLTPISLINLAQAQYENATNQIKDIYQKTIVQHISNYGTITSNNIEFLLDEILKIRQQDADVRQVLFDSTSPVVGFPATLPQLGISPLVQPGFELDGILGQDLIRCHDGHYITTEINNLDFRYTIFGKTTGAPVARSDGNSSPAIGSFTSVPPSKPYKGEFWISPQANGEPLTLVFNVVSDGKIEPVSARNGEYWYNREENILYSWSGSSWVVESSVTNAWVEIDLAQIQNTLILMVEQRLFSGINKNARKFDFSALLKNAHFSRLLSDELFTFAALNNYDPLAPDYKAGDAFTWNYSRGNLLDFPKLSTPTVPARWHDILLAHHEAIHGVIPTPRPNLEPFKLLGFETLEEWKTAPSSPVPFKAEYISLSSDRLWSTSMWVDIKAYHASTGLKLSVDILTDELLPPYINGAAASNRSSNALTNVGPTSHTPLPGVNLPYLFGQSSPVETVWKKSIDYGYSLAKALFRFDPLAFLGFCWGFNWVEVDNILYDGFNITMPGPSRFKLHGEQIEPHTGGTLAVKPLAGAIGKFEIEFTAYDQFRKQNFSITSGTGKKAYLQEGVRAIFENHEFLIEDNGVPFRIGDKFSVVSDDALEIKFTPAQIYKFNGFGQTFTHALRAISIDTNNSFAVNAYRGWNVNMGYRAGGLLSTNDLKVFANNTELTDNSYRLILKKNELAHDRWLQSLRVQVTKFGAAEKSEDDLYFPEGRGADWEFRIEGYNPRYLDISYFELDSSNGLVTFNALSGSHTTLEWYQPTQIKKTVKTKLPITIIGVQNVINFLYGYSAYLHSQGWEFNSSNGSNTDFETGRRRDWQLEIEKFVDACYGGIKLGQGHVVNPFADKVWLNQETGLLSEFYDIAIPDISGHPGIYDALGVKIKTSDLKILRSNAKSEIGATVPMFSVHAQIDEFEHLFIFNNYSNLQDSGELLYHPFSGSRVITYKFNAKKQANKTMRPEYAGHFIIDNKVVQNLQASTDSVAQLYDVNTLYENEDASRNALALLGFDKKDYLTNLDITDKTHFNFWRGLIHSKGTNMSIDAYLNNDRFKDAKLDEFWAYKIAEYGDARQKTFPELRLSVADSLQQFTKIQFDPVEGAWDKAINPHGELPGFTIVSSADETKWTNLEDLHHDASFLAEEAGHLDFDVVAGEIVKIPFIADSLVRGAGSVTFETINATTIKTQQSGKLRVTGYGPASPKYNPVKLFNYIEKELIEEIPVWHPAIGVHSPHAMENINIISNLNPAKFNYSTQTENNHSYDPLRPWGDKELGRVWFNTSNLSYIPYFDSTLFPDVDERLSRWGALAEHASIDVYEWVKSTVSPYEYNALARAEAGDADIDESIRAAGEVAGEQTYMRERAWSIFPIAWSHTPVLPSTEGSGHPSFFTSFSSRLLIESSPDSGHLLYLDSHSFKEYGIYAGMRIGAWDWDPDYPKPLSELIITDQFTKKIATTDIDGNAGDSFTTITTTIGQITEDSDLSLSFPIEDCDGKIFGYTFSTTDKIDPLATQEIYDCSGLIGYGYPSFSTINSVALEDCEGLVEAYIAPFSVIQVLTQQPVTVDVEVISHEDVIGPITIEAVEPITTLSVNSTDADPIWETPFYVRLIENITGKNELMFLNLAIGTQEARDPIVYKPAVPAVPEQPATAGTYLIKLNSGTSGNTNIPQFPYANIRGEFQTGKTYSVEITIDGVVHDFSVAGEDVSSFQSLIASLNLFLPGSPVTLLEDAILFTSPSVGADSHIYVSGGNLFAMLPGYSGMERKDGHDIIPEIPEIPEVPAQPGITPNGTHGATLTLQAGRPYVFISEMFGLKFTITPKVSGIYAPESFQDAIIRALMPTATSGGGLFLQDAVKAKPVVDMVENYGIVGNKRILSNDPLDADTEEGAKNIGWVAWNVPTQEQLDADGQQPNSSWKPYVGDRHEIDPNIIVIQEAISYFSNPLTLNDGTEINRYAYTWKDWKILHDTIYKITNAVDGISDVKYEHIEKIDPNRTTVYINGLAQLSAKYVIHGTVLTVKDVNFGSEVTIIIRKNQPTLAELSFNPDISEDYTYQHQYKIDFEYVSLPIRDLEGSIISTDYYFWVKNKTTTAHKKKASIQAIAQELREGPQNFITFQNLIPASQTQGPRYDAITFSGLNFLVTKENTYKLRFTRNFTLRDDPQGLDLKDTHTEWTLLRENQKMRIPEKLWQKLTDSVVGFDEANNPIPSVRRELYDERNGTSIRYGFGVEQSLAPLNLLRNSIKYIIQNTKLVIDVDGVNMSDYITFLDLDDPDAWFSTPQAARETMSLIWAEASIQQVNEIFFACMNEILACNYELTDIFKTSRLSAHSIKVVQTTMANQPYI